MNIKMTLLISDILYMMRKYNISNSTLKEIEQLLIKDIEK